MLAYAIIVVVLSVLLGIGLIPMKSGSDTSTDSNSPGSRQQSSVEKMTTRNTSPSNIQMNLGNGKLTATDVIGGTVYADRVDLGNNTYIDSSGITIGNVKLTADHIRILRGQRSIRLYNSQRGSKGGLSTKPPSGKGDLQVIYARDETATPAKLAETRWVISTTDYEKR